MYFYNIIKVYVPVNMQTQQLHKLTKSLPMLIKNSISSKFNNHFSLNIAQNGYG